MRNHGRWEGGFLLNDSLKSWRMGRRPLGQDSFHKGTQWHVHCMAYHVCDSVRLLYIPEFSLYANPSLQSNYTMLSRLWIPHVVVYVCGG